MRIIDDFIIDPPWPQRRGGLRPATDQGRFRDKRGIEGRDLDYATLPVTDIFQLLDQQIFPAASDSHNVFLWAIDKFLPDAEKEMGGRGYRLHTRLIWDKGNGLAPAFTVRFSHEYLLWYYKPQLRPVCSTMRGKFTTVIREASREHSRKPDAAYDLVKALYPDSVRMDVFSREDREGWLAWGESDWELSRGEESA